MRQITLDTETTGLEPEQGHRIIEIGCIELLQRRPTGRRFHRYLQPDRKIEREAEAVHGITNDFLKHQPRFADIVNELMDFIKDAELIIHNAKFDVGFINHELKLLKQTWQPIDHYCKIVDTLALARERHPGQQNNLDALCKRYNIDNSKRQLHGALLDAELLAEIYLAMTGGQVSLLSATDSHQANGSGIVKRLSMDRQPLPMIFPTADELEAHQQRLTAINKASGGKCLWLATESP